MKIQKLYPSCKDYIWGGNKLKQDYNKEFDGDRLAESWELSFHPDGKTRLKDGRTLEEAASPADIGVNVARFKSFPLLIKFIDAKENLSVQVHPSDEYASANGLGVGKSEMWYIAEAQEDAAIYIGFNRDVARNEVERAIADGTLLSLLNRRDVKRGECYFIPSGTVHAIGAGCLILEIQENSNITYRVFDYGRRDKNGNQRELHIDKALEVADLKAFTPVCNTANLLCANKYFTVRKYCIEETLKLPADKNSFRCITVTNGKICAEGQTYSRGDSFFCPADCNDILIEGRGEIIISEVRKYFLTIELNDTETRVCITDDNGTILATRSLCCNDGYSDRIKKGADSVLGTGGLTLSDIYEIKIVNNN